MTGLTTFPWAQTEAVLSVIAATEEPDRAECDNLAIIEATGLHPATVGEILEKLWSQDWIEGVVAGGPSPAQGVNLRGIRRVLPGRDRLWGIEGLHR